MENVHVIKLIKVHILILYITGTLEHVENIAVEMGCFPSVAAMALTR